MEDIGYYLAPHSIVRELPYWGIFLLSAGSLAVFQDVGLRLLVIVEAFGMLYWGIFPLSAGSPAVFQDVGLRLLVIVEAFGMLYWGIFPFGPFFQS